MLKLRAMMRKLSLQLVNLVKPLFEAVGLVLFLIFMAPVLSILEQVPEMTPEEEQQFMQQMAASHTTFDLI